MKEQLISTPMPTQIPSREQIAQMEKENHKNLVRSKITMDAGDQPSLLGVTTDATHLLLYHLATMAKQLHEADSLEEVRAAAKPFAELTENLLAQVESGEVKLPFLAKGQEQVISDIAQRATAVSGALQKPDGGAQETETKVPKTQSTEPRPEPARQKPVLSQAGTENGEPRLSEEDREKIIDERVQAQVQEQVQAKVKQKMQELMSGMGS